MITPLRQLLDESGIIASAYIYGSALDKGSNYKDIDVLLIVKDGTDLKKLLKLSEKMAKLDRKIEITSVTNSEYEYAIHQSLSSFFYLNISKRSKLIYGDDRLKSYNQNKNLKETFCRIAFITQRMRNAMVDKDDQDINYFNKKLDKWIKYLVQELTYMIYGSEKNEDEAFQYFISKNPEFDLLDGTAYSKTVFLCKLEYFACKQLNHNKSD